MTFINTSGVEYSLRRVWNNAGAPTSGTSGTFAGSAQPGDLLCDTTNKKLYINTNTAASPTWSPFASNGITAKTATATLTAAEAGIIDVQTDGIYIYLPTYVGNTGLVYEIKVSAAYSAGVVLTGSAEAQNIDGDNFKRSSAQYDTLRVIAFSQGWNIIEKIGTWT